MRRFRCIDELLVATTMRSEDSPIVEECKRLGASFFCGDEQDVLDRSYRGAREVSADVIVRITSDCLLIDPDVSDRTIREFLEKRPDYASNALERTYPRGLDTEVVQFSALECAAEKQKNPPNGRMSHRTCTKIRDDSACYQSSPRPITVPIGGRLIRRSGTILFRCDANVTMGTGHVMRCLALAQALQDTGGQVAFAMRETTAAVEERLHREGIEVARLRAEGGSGDFCAGRCSAGHETR